MCACVCACARAVAHLSEAALQNPFVLEKLDKAVCERRLGRHIRDAGVSRFEHSTCGCVRACVPCTLLGTDPWPARRTARGYPVMNNGWALGEPKVPHMHTQRTYAYHQHTLKKPMSNMASGAGRLYFCGRKC